MCEHHMGFAFLCLRLFLTDARVIVTTRYNFLVLRLIETVFAPTPSRPNIAAANVPINKLPPYAGAERSKISSHGNGLYTPVNSII